MDQETAGESIGGQQCRGTSVGFASFSCSADLLLTCSIRLRRIGAAGFRFAARRCAPREPGEAFSLRSPAVAGCVYP